MTAQLKVLIVDDSLSMRTVASRIITGLGHDVVAQAANGKEALKEFVSHHPDVVLLDLVMPIFDGKRTLKKLIQVDPSAQIVICSSLGSEGDIQFCLSEGAKFYLQKPYEEQGFKTAFDNICASMESTD